MATIVEPAYLQKPRGAYGLLAGRPGALGLYYRINPQDEGKGGHDDEVKEPSSAASGMDRPSARTNEHKH